MSERASWGLGRSTILGIAGVGIALWLFSLSRAEHKDPTNRSPDDANRHPTSSSGDLNQSRDAVLSAPLPELSVEVKDPSGKRLSGVVAWRKLSGSAAPGPMPMFSGAEQNGIHQTRIDGIARIQPPRGSSVWLKFTELRDPSRAWYRLIEPITEDHREHWVIDRKVRGLHVYVWNASMTGPAANAEVAVFAGAPDSGSRLARVSTMQTNHHGYAYSGPLPPGRYLVVAPNSQPHDAFPSSMQVIMPPRVPVAETLCTVVAQSISHEVSLRVQARMDGPRVSRYPAKMYLAQSDDGSKVFPVRNVISNGDSTLTVRVPDGTYELRSIPVGSLEFTGGKTQLVVEGEDCSRNLSVRKARATVQVELVGIEDSAFPVLVHPRRCDDAVLGEREDLVFMGDYRWTSPKRHVPPVPHRCRLVVRGRGHFYLSKEKLKLEDPRAIVPVVRAGCMEFRWLGERAQAQKEAMVRISSLTNDAESQVVSLRKTLLRDGVRLQPGFVASVVVATGKTKVTCLGPTGAEHWNRTTNVGPELTRIEIRE